MRKRLDMLCKGVLLLYVDAYRRLASRERDYRVASGDPLCGTGLGGLLRTNLYVLVGTNYRWVKGQNLADILILSEPKSVEVVQCRRGAG